MNFLNDVFTVALVLVLLFGSVSLYLYTRIQQAEQKISLLEAIFLEIRVNNEIDPSYFPPADIPAFSTDEELPTVNAQYEPFNEDLDHVEEVDDIENTTATATATATATPTDNTDTAVNAARVDDAEVADTGVSTVQNTENSIRLSVNYEALSLKELQTLAKNRGIKATKKSAIIESLKLADSAELLSSGSDRLHVGVGAGTTGSFLETSGTFQSTPNHSTD
jgi:hypothetical protein